VEIVAEVRAIGMAGDLRLLPGRELGVGLLQRFPGLRLELGKFFLDGDRALLGGKRLQLGDLAFEFGNRLFEIEIGTHRPQSASGDACPSNWGPIRQRRLGCKWTWRRDLSTKDARQGKA